MGQESRHDLVDPLPRVFHKATAKGMDRIRVLSEGSTGELLMSKLTHMVFGCIQLLLD